MKDWHRGLLKTSQEFFLYFNIYFFSSLLSYTIFISLEYNTRKVAGLWLKELQPWSKRTWVSVHFCGLLWLNYLYAPKHCSVRLHPHFLPLPCVLLQQSNNNHSVISCHLELPIPHLYHTCFFLVYNAFHSSLLKSYLLFNSHFSPQNIYFMDLWIPKNLL
jgi:hypothetical protein